MIRVTIETDDIKCSVDNATGTDLGDIVQLCEQAIRGCGFFPKGELDFIEPEFEDGALDK
jgi:hypothetical protein